MSDKEKDSLYILPLSIIPLETEGLRQARLIKNARLQGVVELFCGKGTGSGQVQPHHLGKFFDLSGSRAKDGEIVLALSRLASYDVYSLRVELRKLGINIDEHEHLQISKEMQQELTKYMMTFTRPLIKFIFEDQNVSANNFQDIVDLFANPDGDMARKNLAELAKRLQIDVLGIPAFLQDYADVYLSLSYYQYCLDQNMPQLKDFFTAMREIKDQSYLKNDPMRLRTCTAVSDKMESTIHDIRRVLDLFKDTTTKMWEDLSAANFGTVKSLIEFYQSRVGGALCAITVKMNAWRDAFPMEGAGGLSRRVDFIVSDIKPGIELIEAIGSPE